MPTILHTLPQKHVTLTPVTLSRNTITNCLEFWIVKFLLRCKLGLCCLSLHSFAFFDSVCLCKTSRMCMTQKRGVGFDVLLLDLIAKVRWRLVLLEIGLVG